MEAGQRTTMLNVAVAQIPIIYHLRISPTQTRKKHIGAKTNETYLAPISQYDRSLEAV